MAAMVAAQELRHNPKSRPPVAGIEAANSSLQRGFVLVSLPVVFNGYLT
jgi:hypothetical protein